MERRARLVTWDELAQAYPQFVIDRVPELRREPLVVLGRDGEDPGAEILALPGAIIGPMGVYFDGHLLADDVHYLPPDWVEQSWPAYSAAGDGWFVASGEIEREIDGTALFVDSFGGLGNFSHFVRETLPYGLLQADLLAGGIDAPALLPTWRFPAQADLAAEFFGPTVEKNDAWTRVEKLLVVRRRWVIDDNPRLPVNYRVPRRELWRVARFWADIAAVQDAPPTGAPVYLWREWDVFGPSIRAEDRSLANGLAVDRLLEDRGFLRIDPLTTPVHDVIRAVAAAPVVAGLHGAQMIHVAWANRSAVHVELTAGEAVNEHHRVLADALDLPTVRLAGQADDPGKELASVDLDELATTLDELLGAASTGDYAVRWSLALIDARMETDSAETSEDLLVRRADESTGEYVERVRWGSTTPREDLQTVLSDLAAASDTLDLGGRLALAGLAADLRAPAYYDLALARLAEDGSSDWARLVRADITRLRDGADALATVVEAELPRLAGLPDDLQSRWLALGAKAGRPTVAAVAAVLTGTPAWERRACELDLHEPIGPSHRARLAELVAEQPRRGAADARACVDYLIDRIEAVGPFRSQSVPWIDYDTFDDRQVTAVVDAALTAAEQGTGYSCVRLGDGEGLALAGERANIGGALGADENGDWNELAPADYAEFRRWLGSSLRNADFVGVPDIVQCVEGPDGCVDVVLGCIDHDVPADHVVAGGWDIAWALEVSGAVDRLLERCTGMIGPVDPTGFGYRRPAREIEWLSIPGELHMYGRRPSLEESHWARSTQVLAHEFRPGQLWLVGAGMLGKIYCSAIKEAGAVAVDVGSLMDLWSGRQHTRGTLRYQPWVLTPYAEPE